MTFWIITGFLALAAALIFGWTLLRPRGARDAEMERIDIQIYRDQLQAVEKDLARGVVTGEEAERLRTEIKRRILDADRAGGGEPNRAPRGLSFAVAAVCGLLVIGGSFFLYDWIGAPGYADLPIKKRFEMAADARAERPGQAELEARVPPSPPVEASEDFLKLMDQLREAVKARPDELEGWVLLARNEAQLGNLPAAQAAQRRVIDLKGDEATSQDYTTYAAMMIQAAGGIVSPEADGALSDALKRDPMDPIARYYVGLMHLQTGRPDETFYFWEPLLRMGPPDAPWIPIIRSRIESVAAMAGIKYALPAAPGMGAGGSGGPSAADMAAAAEMSPEERQQFIQSMVEQLGARLAEEGGPPADWAKLIRALGVQGNTQKAAEIWAEAQRTFSDPAELAPIRQAAEMAGVADAGDGTDANAASEPPQGSGAEAAPRGPTREDIDAASRMTAGERSDMVDGMVGRLMDRLATEGGPPSDWAMLIRSLGITGNSAKAAEIWAEAQQRFADSDQLEVIRQAAVAAGVAE